MPTAAPMPMLKCIARVWVNPTTQGDITSRYPEKPAGAIPPNSA